MFHAVCVFVKRGVLGSLFSRWMVPSNTTPLELTAMPLKPWMVGILSRFLLGFGLFSGAFAVFFPGGVISQISGPPKTS